MARNVLSVLAGYVVMFVFVMLTFSLVWMALGSGFAFEAGSTRVTIGWVVIALVLSFLAAIAGGWVTSKIAVPPGRVPVIALASLVLVLGVLAAVSATSREIPPLPDRPLGTLEAASYAESPAWYHYSVPIIGVAGVLLGGSLGRAAGRPPSAA